MEDSYIAGSELLLQLQKPDESPSSLLRRAVAALGRFAGEGFQPNSKRGASFLAGERDAALVTLKHPAFSALNSWVQMSFGDFAPDGTGPVFLTIHLDEPGDALGQEWEMAVSLTTQLVTGLSPRLAHLTAWHLDNEGPTFPSLRLLPGTELPEEFGPWTYLAGESRTDEVRDRLAALPAYSTQAFADGWLVRAVETPRDEPSQHFLDALAALDAGTITSRTASLRARADWVADPARGAPVVRLTVAMKRGRIPSLPRAKP